MKRNKLI